MVVLHVRVTKREKKAIEAAAAAAGLTVSDWCRGVLNNWLSKQRCRVCGCTEDDCSGCIERTGEPCYWLEEDLCSACGAEVARAER